MITQIKPVFIRLQMDFYYKNSTTNIDCLDCLERAENLGIPAFKHCPDCSEADDMEDIKNYKTREVIVPLDDIQDFIFLGEAEVRIKRYSEKELIPIRNTITEIEEKLSLVSIIV
jgi:hypothetical protein